MNLQKTLKKNTLKGILKVVVNEEWLAGNNEYIERKVLKELKLKRKREEKNHLVDGQEDKGKERVINIEEDAERKRKIKGKGKEEVVDVEEDVEQKRKIKVNGKEKVDNFEKGSEKNESEKKTSGIQKLEHKSFKEEREIAELQNDYIGIGEIQDDVGEGEEPNQKEELYEMLEENINNILIEKSEIEEKINESLIKFQDDEKLLQLKQRMKDIFKEPDMPEYLSSSSSESDDDNDDGSQLADENEESYRKETHSNDEDNVEIIAENEEEIIRKGREFSAKIRKKAQQQEREQKRKGKKEKDQIGPSSQESPIFGIDNSLQDPAVELTEDEKLLGRSIFSTQEEEE
ncbi:hypothetical protein Tco_0665371 [Tanacetum coccineum]